MHRFCIGRMAAVWLLVVAVLAAGCPESKLGPGETGQSDAGDVKGQEVGPGREVRIVDIVIPWEVLPEAGGVEPVGDWMPGEIDPNCTPQCEEAECGPDGCGGKCGKCPADMKCATEVGLCVPCIPNCEGMKCGTDDGCGGTCATCTDEPGLKVSPTWVDFDKLPAGGARIRTVHIISVGTMPLFFTGFKLEGDASFSVLVKDKEYFAGVPVDVAFPEPIALMPGTATYVKVRFSPVDSDAAEAALTIFSNDLDYPKGVVVKIVGNAQLPCLDVQPAKVDFGGTVVGGPAEFPVKLVSCGDKPVEVDAVVLEPGASQAFSYKLVEAPPFVLQPSETAEIKVVYSPQEVADMDPGGDLVGDLGTLVVKSDSFGGNASVKLSGYGVAQGGCPTPVIHVEEGEEVIPQTNLHLYGDMSYASSGKVKKWEWDVDQPSGSMSSFVPSNTFPNPTFETNVAGVYTFYLTVYDEADTPSCFPAKTEVIVIPDEALHIELLWTTPEDKNETDIGPQAGSDLDLHFLHPWAAGPDLDGDGAPDGWFDIPFDCFWFNAHPNWGGYDPSIDDDPGLDRDDTDGAGPENINFDIPEDVAYQVGVHYWNDHGYGAAYATVRIYVYAQLVYEVADMKLVDSDMWWVCSIEWPMAKVKPTVTSNGQPKVVQDYHNPYFFQ